MSMRAGGAVALTRRRSSDLEDAEKVDRIPELDGEDGVPWLSSALMTCDRATGGHDVAVFVHADVMLLPSFGARLQLAAEQFGVRREIEEGQQQSLIACLFTLR